MNSIRFSLALWISKLSVIAINIIAKGRGTNLPGQIALRIDPHFVKHIKGADPEKCVFVTGTNGEEYNSQSPASCVHKQRTYSSCQS